MATQKHEAPEEITISRTGEPPLRFKAVSEWVGSTRTHNSTRWTVVRIYKTVGGKFVAEVKNITQWQGEHDFVKAKSFSTAQEVIDYLRDGEGRLGRASQEALEYAAGLGPASYDNADPEFQSAFVEVVD